jgi:hypothetical protein
MQFIFSREKNNREVRKTYPNNNNNEQQQEKMQFKFSLFSVLICQKTKRSNQ